MSVTLTEKAAQEVKRIMEDQKIPAGMVLRMGAQGGGCSGFNYSLGFDHQTDASQDELSEEHGIKIAVDRTSLLYLDGTVVDFYEGIDRRGFTFNNPHAQKSCGCGSSFSV